VESVWETADEGVGGIVAEAGVRGTAVDCFRLFCRGSTVLAWITTSSCIESGVGKRTRVNLLGPFLGSLSFNPEDSPG